MPGKIPWREEPGRLVHGVSRSNMRLSNFTFTFHFHTLEKEMATHSSVLVWRIPRMAEPGGLPSVGSHRVRHNWTHLAAAAAWNIIKLLNFFSLSITFFIVVVNLRHYIGLFQFCSFPFFFFSFSNFDFNFLILLSFFVHLFLCSLFLLFFSSFS